MRIACVYHSIDLDGWMSAAIVKHWFNTEEEKTEEKIRSLRASRHLVSVQQDSIDFIGYNYDQDMPDLSLYGKVIMCDISFPKEVMLRLFDRLDTNFIWIDHHISAITDIIGADYNYLDNVDESTLLNGLRDRVYAACELTWDFFFPDNDKPEIVRLLGLYDSFRHKGTPEEQKVLEFQYGARQAISNYEEAYKALELSLRSDDNGEYIIKPILESGKSIYQYLCTEAKQTYKNGFVVKFSAKGQQGITGAVFTLKDGSKEFHDAKLNFICFNANRFNPINFGIDYHKDGYDGVMIIHFANRKWNVSLYNDNGLVDCSVIAKQYGGGGHKGASGFILDSIEKTLEIFPMAEELREVLKSAL